MYSPNRRKCQPICKYGIVSPSCSRANGNCLSRNEHSVVSHLFFPIRLAIQCCTCDRIRIVPNDIFETDDSIARKSRPSCPRHCDYDDRIVIRIADYDQASPSTNSIVLSDVYARERQFEGKKIWLCKFVSAFFFSRSTLRNPLFVYFFTRYRVSLVFFISIYVFPIENVF